MSMVGAGNANDFLCVNLCGIEHLNTRDTLTLREHGRTDYHILYIAEGKCYAEIGGNAVIAEAGSIILYLPGSRQKYAFKKRDGSVSCYLHFGGTVCENLLRSFGFTEDGVYQIGKSNVLVSIIEKTEREKHLKSINYESLCAAYLLEFLSLAGRKMQTAGNQTYQKNKQLLERVCDLMLAEYMHAHPLQYYADFCNLSLGRFSHVFKESMGVSPHEYLTRIRIEKAQQLLRINRLSVAEVAECTGFSGQNYFSRTFKRYTGKSPRNYAADEWQVG